MLAQQLTVKEMLSEHGWYGNGGARVCFVAFHNGGGNEGWTTPTPTRGSFAAEEALRAETWH